MELIHDPGARPLDILRLITKKARRVNVSLELLRRNLKVILRPSIFAKKVGSDDVDASVSTLGREYRRNEQLKGVRVGERAVGVGIGPLEPPDYLKGAFFVIFDHKKEAKKNAVKMQMALCLGTIQHRDERSLIGS